ncbi:D-ribose pyranase [Aliiruegeria sabulilitoris]|uniref:D-ribose pyranase n=1 Tax=Aliiruegeria sabulilitoris TaxID=1510458 RepID=UPI00083354AA|nr:D-ribose pyranase [Aliiruegeria sabulilitoris]NDR59330.1 D-ribose pyranase [Pseudoruegeria sp. M32A2M]
MRKAGLLNAPIARVVSLMGHTDSLCIGDAGLPVPDGVERIDLAVSAGLPGFLDVLPAVFGELFVERAVIAQEMPDGQPAFHAKLLRQIQALEQAQGNTITVTSVPHEEFKRLTRSSKAVVRTGEFTPYANILLYSGVPF